MIKFSAFINLMRSIVEEKKTGTYVSVLPDDVTKRNIHALISDLKIENRVEDDKLHATVLYSRAHVDHSDVKENMHMPTMGIGDELTTFSQRNGKKCLVLKISSVDLRGLHASLIKLGGTHDFPTYEAHITLCYDLDDSYEIPKLESLCIPLKFIRYECKDLDDE